MNREQLINRLRVLGVPRRTIRRTLAAVERQLHLEADPTAALKDQRLHRQVVDGRTGL
jgi:hypothetical protein